MLEPKKVTYSNREGISIEFVKPGALELTLQEVIFLLGLLDSVLSQEELNQHFTAQEQQIVMRYMQLNHEKMTQEMQSLSTGKAPLKLPKRLKQRVTQWMLWSSIDATSFATNVWGWNIPFSEEKGLSVIDQLIDQALVQENYPKHYFETLLKESAWGTPSDEMMKRLEDQYGPFNVESI